MNTVEYNALLDLLHRYAIRGVTPQDMLKMVTLTIAEMRDLSDLDAVLVVKAWSDSVYTALVVDNLNL